jgi:DNA gyrase subunit B
VRRGKKLEYLPDERSMTTFLVDRAAEGRSVVCTATNKKYAGQNLAKKLQLLHRYQYFVDKMRRRGFEQKLLEVLLAQGLRYRKQFEEPGELADVITALEDNGYRVVTGHDDEHNLTELHVSTDVEALTLTVPVNHDLVDGADYRELMNLHKETSDFHESSFEVRSSGDVEATIRTKEELLSYLMSVAKKGIKLQRYKGLGEMNADQLWDTTMNPETRRLLQVTIEDEVAADEIFSVLMGNQVEPRRDFIQAHAHEVENLDV